MSPNGLVVGVGTGSHVHFFDVEIGAAIGDALPTTSAGGVRRVQFSPDGKWVSTVHTFQKFGLLWVAPDKASAPVEETTFQRRVAQ